jgi:hypothetical protein
LATDAAATTEKSTAADYSAYGFRKVNEMDALIDYLILTTAVVCSLGIAFMAQRAALRLLLKAMNRTGSTSTAADV